MHVQGESLKTGANLGIRGFMNSPSARIGGVPELSKRADGQATGMLGVYLVAAELSRRGFIVSPTSRSARGADLLVTDQSCNKAWSVQVKTNRAAPKFWLLGAHAAHIKSKSHVYVFVNLRGSADRPDYYVVGSSKVAGVMLTKKRKASTWYSFRHERVSECKENWKLFGAAA